MLTYISGSIVMLLLIIVIIKYSSEAHDVLSEAREDRMLHVFAMATAVMTLFSWVSVIMFVLIVSLHALLDYYANKVHNGEI